MAASLMFEEKRDRMLATSSGNTGSALAAYAARFGFGLDLYVLETASRQKLVQAEAYGARVIRVPEVRGHRVRDQTRWWKRLKARARTSEAVLLTLGHLHQPAADGRSEDHLL